MTEEIRVAKEQSQSAQRKLNSLEGELQGLSESEDDLSIDAEKRDLVEQALKLDQQCAELKKEQSLMQLKMGVKPQDNKQRAEQLASRARSVSQIRQSTLSLPQIDEEQLKSKRNAQSNVNLLQLGRYGTVEVSRAGNSRALKKRYSYQTIRVASKLSPANGSADRVSEPRKIPRKAKD